MHSTAVDLFQMLVHAGAAPGEDFSCDGEKQAFHISQHGCDLLRQAYPDIHWDDVFAPSTYDPSPELALLHQYLGVPFVDGLLDTIQRRLQELTDAQAGWYLRQLLGGIEQRTGLLLCPLLEETLDLPTQARLEWLLRLPENTLVACDLWIEDLVLAAGGTSQDVELTESGYWLTERGMELLEMLWAGEFELTLVSIKQR